MRWIFLQPMETKSLLKNKQKSTVTHFQSLKGFPCKWQALVTSFPIKVNDNCKATWSKESICSGTLNQTYSVYMPWICMVVAMTYHFKYSRFLTCHLHGSPFTLWKWLTFDFCLFLSELLVSIGCKKISTDSTRLYTLSSRFVYLRGLQRVNSNDRMASIAS